MADNKDKIKTNLKEWFKGQFILLFAALFIFLLFRELYQIIAAVFIFFVGGVYGFHIRGVRGKK